MHGRSRMMFASVVLAWAAVAPAQTPSQRYALPAPDARYTLEAQGVDRAKALAEDAAAPKFAPQRYALSRDVGSVSIANGTARGGEWRELPDGTALWRLPVHAAGALTLDFGFRRFFLPPGARMYVSNAANRLGPYSDAENSRSGTFWTPLLYGDDALIEITVPANLRAFLSLELRTVHVGYRDVLHAKSFADPTSGSGSCNIDTICPDGDAWRNEIGAEAVLAFDGGFCSGQLVNDALDDRVPYMTTANHCIATDADADSLVVYWKYESPVCRAVGSAANGDPVSTVDAIPQVGGATLVATYAAADVTLVRLNTAPPAGAAAYFDGWDRSETSFSGAAVVHHAQSDAKRISFPAGVVTLEDDLGSDLPGLHHWFVDHYASGTTETGSSGSGLIDADHHLRGVLSGGAASCDDTAGDDLYGRLSTAWEGGGTPSTRLRDWLDPKNTQITKHDGLAVCTIPNVALDVGVMPVLSDQQFTVSASASGGTAPYTYAFDLDGDGMPDNLDHSASSVAVSYPHEYLGNVAVTVSDRNGCVGHASRAVVVQAQNVVYAPTNGIGQGPDPAIRICGGNTVDAEPGERFDARVTLGNVGSAPTAHGYAVFAAEPGLANAADVTIETPAVPLPTLASKQSATVDMTFAISPGAACGSEVVIDYLGTADDNGFSSNPARVAVLNVATGGACQPVANCPAQVAGITPHPGNFFDPHRAGNGMTQLTIPVPGTGPVFFGAWFTGDDARNPTWYVVNDIVKGNQVNSTLYQTRQSTPDEYPVPGVEVGTAQVSFVASDKLVYTWNLNGTPGGAVYVPVVADSARSLREWFNPQQSGWGTFDEFFPSVGADGGTFVFSLAYLYDANGMPRWTTASDASYRDGKTLTAMVARPACPACIWLDYTLGAQPVGTLLYSSNAGGELITTNIVFPSAYPGSWVRTNYPIVPLVSP
ncbi:MAG TPA: hypothetical protein VFB32_12045 [Rudaea sp.]|nr:hypothetical protein [Rudaea sp.]